MMDLVERKDTKEEWKLPKNIRQIGEPGNGTRIFIEVYAYTYLHQLAEENLTSMKTAVLVGDAKEESRIFIQGALELDMGRESRSWFSNEHWREIFREIHEWYEGMDVVDSIAAVQTDENDKPVEDVIIESITIQTL